MLSISKRWTRLVTGNWRLVEKSLTTLGGNVNDEQKRWLEIDDENFRFLRPPFNDVCESEKKFRLDSVNLASDRVTLSIADRRFARCWHNSDFW